MIARPKPPTRSDATADRLRVDILQATLVPGEALAEAAVARRLGVSRVPVREALFTLEREGLVEFSATGRAYVKELTARDVHELYAMRLTLEPIAARSFRETIKGRVIVAVDSSESMSASA